MTEEQVQDRSDVPPASDGMMEETLCCIICDYNLRGLRPEGLCPECGGPVCRSQEATARWTQHRWKLTVDHILINTLALYSPGLLFLFLSEFYGLKTAFMMFLESPLALPSNVIALHANQLAVPVCLCALLLCILYLALVTRYSLRLTRRLRPTWWIPLALFCPSLVQVLLVLWIIRAVLMT